MDRNTLFPIFTVASLPKSTTLVSTTSQSTGKVEKPAPLINFSLDVETIFVLVAFAWLIWDKVFKDKVVKKLDSAFQPLEEERRLNNILAQIGVVTRASRVVLTAFHNGAIDTNGYHLTKISTINSYTAPGESPMATPIRDLPVGRIMYEIEEMLGTQEEGNCWSVIEYSDELPQGCRDHLNKNNIGRMYNRLICVGNLPIGILSLQYSQRERRRPPVQDAPNAKILEDCYEQICLIMRRRVIHPSFIKQVFFRLTGNSQANPSL